MTSTQASGTNSRQGGRSSGRYVLAAVVAIVVIVVIVAGVYFLLMAPPSNDSGSNSNPSLTVVPGSSMTWTVYSGANGTAALPFMVITWNVTAVNGRVVTVNQTSEVVGSGIPTYQNTVVTPDDLKTGPAGITTGGLSATGPAQITTPFGPRNCTVYQGTVSYVIYTAPATVWQGMSNGVLYVVEVFVNSGASSVQVRYVVTAGNIPEL